jgi:hypothetical protein
LPKKRQPPLARRPKIPEGPHTVAGIIFGLYVVAAIVNLPIQLALQHWGTALLGVVLSAVYVAMFPRPFIRLWNRWKMTVRAVWSH